VLENIRSAYNVGSVFRTSDAFLLESIYICGYTAYPPHKEIKKTALGAEETVKWRYFKKTNEAIGELRKENFRIYSIEQAMNSHPLQQVKFEKMKSLLSSLEMK
jgi:tRNA G18 (ribose-2'-O)-methylase SpoU